MSQLGSVTLRFARREPGDEGRRVRDGGKGHGLTQQAFIKHLVFARHRARRLHKHSFNKSGTFLPNVHNLWKSL